MNEELQLVRYRVRMLDIMEQKLLEMRKLATHAKDNLLSFEEIKIINNRLNELMKQVKCIDEESKLV